jgi:hypothetical protein
MKEYLETGANIASILTAIVAAFFFCQFQLRARDRRIKLEQYLKQDKANARPNFTGKRTVIHLMGKLKLTEDEVFHACFQSDHIACKTAVDPDTHRATEILFEYVEK